MIKTITTRLNATIGQFLKQSNEDWEGKLMRLDSKTNHSLLNLFDDIFNDLDLFSKLSKRTDFLERTKAANWDEEVANEESQKIEEEGEANEERRAKVKKEIDLGEWRFVEKMEFYQGEKFTNLLKMIAKFFDLVIHLMTSEKIDLLTRMDLITIPIKLKITNIFKDFSVSKKSEPSPAPELQQRIVNFLVTRQREVRRLKSSQTSEMQTNVAKSFLVFFSRFKGEFSFDFEEVYKQVQIIFTKNSEQIWVLNCLFVFKNLDTNQTRLIEDLDISKMNLVLKLGLEYVLKGATQNWKLRLTTGMLSDLVKSTVSPMVGKNKITEFKNRLGSLFNVVKRYLCAGSNLFEIRFLLEPLKSKLKASFVSKGKKTRPLDVKILTIYSTFLCNLANQLVKRKNGKTKGEMLTASLGYISEFIFESLSFLSISFVDNKYLWPGLLANLETVSPGSRGKLMDRFKAHISSANVNTSCALQSLLYLTDDLFRENKMEMILEIFKNLKEVLGSLDKKTKAHAYRALFYIMYKLGVIKAHLDGKQYADLEDKLRKGQKDTIFRNFTGYCQSNGFSFDHVLPNNDWVGHYLRTAKAYLESENLPSDAKQIEESPFKNSLFELLESYPDLVSGLCGGGELKNCIDFLFPPFLETYEDYCLEEDNFKAMVGSSSGGYSDGAASKIFANNEKNYIVRLSAQMYPKLFKSWLKKFVTDDLEIKKKNKTKKPAKLEGLDSAILPLYFRRKDAIAVSGDSYFSVKKAFDEDLQKLKALGGQLYGVTMLGLPEHDHVERVLNMCLSFMSLCHPNLQVVKSNLAANLRRNPLYRKGFEDLVEGVRGLALERIVKPYQEEKRAKWAAVKAEHRRKRKEQNTNIEESGEENKIEEETNEDKQAEENKQNQLIRCFSTIFAAFSSNLSLLPRFKNQKVVRESLSKDLELATNLLKIIISKETDKERDFLTESLLLLSQIVEKNFKTNELQSFKFPKYLHNTGSLLVKTLLNHSENEFFTKKMFLAEKKTGLNSYKLISFLSLFLESYFQHFDPSKGNIFGLFQVLASLRDLDRKLLWHVANFSGNQVCKLLRNPSTDMVEYAGFLNNFFKFYGAQMGALDLHRRFIQVKLRLWYLKADIPYAGKMGQMSEIKKNLEKLVLLSEHFEKNDLKPRYWSKVNSQNKTGNQKVVRISKVLKRPFPVMPVIQRILAESSNNENSQSGKFLQFLNLYLTPNAGTLEILQKANSLVPEPCSSDIGTIMHLLTIRQLKKAFHQPSTEFYHDTDAYVQALFTEARAKSRFQGTSMLKNPPFRIKKIDGKKLEKELEQNLKSNANLPWEVFEKIIRKSWDLLSSMQFMTKKNALFGAFYTSGRLKIKAPAKGPGGQPKNNNARQTFFLHYNFWLKYVKCFGPAFKKQFFNLMANKLLGPLSESVNVAYVSTICLLMGLRARGLLRSSFEHLIIGGLLRLAMTFNIKFVRLFFLLIESFYYDKTVNFHSINNVFSFIEKYMFGVKHKSQVKWEEWGGIQEHQVGNPKALYLYLRNQFVGIGENQNNENENDNQIEEEKSEVKDEASQTPSKEKKAETMEEWKENILSIVLQLYGNVMFMSPHNLKRRGFQMLKAYKQSTRNFSAMLAFMNKYKKYLSALRNASVPVETEQNTKLLKLFSTTRHRMGEQKEDPTNLLVAAGESCQEWSEDNEPLLTSKQVGLELEKQMELEKPHMTTNSQNKGKCQKLPSLKKDTNFRLFKIMVRSMEDSAANLQVIMNFLASSFQFSCFKAEHFRVVLSKLRQILETESQVEESQRSGLLKQFEGIADKVVTKLNVSNFATEIEQIGKLLANEFSKTDISSYKIFISRLMIVLHLKEFSKKNCDLFVENFGLFIIQNNFLAQNTIFGTLVRTLCLVPLPVFEYLFGKIIQMARQVIDNANTVAGESPEEIQEEGKELQSKESSGVFRYGDESHIHFSDESHTKESSEFWLFTTSFIFSGCLMALRKPRPDLLTDILQTLLSIIRSPLEEKTFLNKGRDSLMNYHEILKPTIDLDHYDYKKEDVKEILQLSGGLSYFA